MKKIIYPIIALVVIIIIVLVSFFVIKNKNNDDSKTLSLTYKTNGGVPYKWEYEIEDDSIVQLVETKDITSKEDKQLDGGPVYINYIFKGLKKGSTTVTFKYVSIVTGEVEKEEVNYMNVDSNKNISLNLIPKK